MKTHIIYLIGLLLVIFTGSTQAQDLDPENPPEPFTMYKVTVKAEPYGYTYGAGSYLLGTLVNISTSAYTDYTFSHWTKNGVEFSTSPSFTYTVDGERADFVAHYDFTPSDPQEPQGVYRHRLFLTNNIQEACSFNLNSGTKVDEDTYVHVEANSNIGYDFLGWFVNGTKVSDVPSFNYLMGQENVTLEARYSYNPINPDEPFGDGSQTDIANGIKGDVNGDGKVTMADAIATMDYYLHWTSASTDDAKYDANLDGKITMADAIEVMNIYLTTK